MAEIRILLADDHAVLRAGLKLLLNNQPDFRVVGEAATGTEALAAVESLQPDLLLLDLNMPEMDGVALLHRLREQGQSLPVIILTMHDDIAHLKQALQAGASGYVVKKAADSELVMAIHAVMRGELFIHSALTHALIDQITGTPAQAEEDPWKRLSERELDVIRQVAQGYTNAEIASRLFLSIKTVETYRARSMEKLGLETRAQLVKSALEYGYLE
jgi:DNA-binding NarL/FixJ family response regulator